MDVERMPAFLNEPPIPRARVALRDARLVNVEGPAGDAGRRWTVLLRDGRIEALLEADAPLPDGARTIGLAGSFVMAGLIDAHIHVTMLADAGHGPAPRHGAEPIRPGVEGHLVARTLRDLVRGGVTTIRDVGAHGDVLLEARQAVRYGAFVAPRILASGRIVSATAPGARFFPEMYREADGPDDIRRAVREAVRAGADFVKVMTTGARSVELEDPGPAQLTKPEIEAFVDEAHRLGIRAAAHCEGIAGTELAIEAGVDTVEHGFHLHERPDLLDRMAAHGAVLVPTLDFLHRVASDGTWTSELETQGIANVERAGRTLEAARRAGVRIAIGSDGVTADGVAREIGRIVEAGASPREALEAATAGGAIALGLERVLGRLEPGARADLVVVAGDPLAAPSVLADPARIRLVLRNGQPVAGTLLERDPFASNEGQAMTVATPSVATGSSVS
jgi:imidazolonepropionase-like amidohydrolase